MPDGSWRGVTIRGDVRLRHAGMFRPAPALFEFLEDEGDAPAGLFVDFGEDLQHFFLLAAVGETLCCMSQGAQSYGCYTSTILSANLK